MRHQSASEEDRAASVNPPIVASMPWRVQSVSVVGPLRLRVSFIDAIEGDVELAALVKSEKAGVFEMLRDADVFNRVYIEHGAVTWPNGPDIAPDAMYRAIREHGIFAPSPEVNS